MSFSIEGFLETEGTIAEQQKAKYGDLFELAYSFSRVGMQLTERLQAARRNRELVGATLLARSVAHFQAIVLLVERGLPVEAMVLTRSLMETSFVICALAKNTVTTEELAQHDLASRRKLASALTRVPSAVLDEHHAGLKSFVKDLDGAKAILVESMASRAGLLDLYNSFYRYLSHIASHPSITASDLYFIEGNGSDRVSFRCVPEDTPIALILTFLTMLIAFGSHEELAGTTPELSAAISELGEQYQLLERRYSVWDRSGGIRPSATARS